MKNLALVAAVGLVAISSAQDPQLNWVKYIDLTSELLNTGISGVAANGDTLYVTGYRTGSTGPLDLVRVQNWGTSATRNVLATDSAAALNRNSNVLFDADTNTIYWGTSLGDTTATNGFELRKLDVNGNLVTSASGNFVDGILTNAEMGSNNYQNFAIDPGFAGGLGKRLGFIVFGSHVVRRFNPADGTGPNNAGADPGQTVATNVRGITFKPNGDAYLRVRNNLVLAPRVADSGAFGGAGTNAFSILSILTTPLANDTNTFDQAFQNVVRVPGGAGFDPFVIVNDRFPATEQAVRFFNENTGMSQFLSLTSTPGGAFTTQVKNFTSAVVGGTTYVFIANFKGTSQGVDVYQVGADGTVNGTVVLSDSLDPAGRTANITVRDSGGNTLETRNVVLGAGGTFSFITTIRGASFVTAKVPGFLRKAASANLGSSPATVTLSLINGDVDENNEVGPNDFALLSVAFGTEIGDPNYDAAADLDENGEVGPSDFAILANNFGQEGD